jgi:hypothetical protein
MIGTAGIIAAFENEQRLDVEQESVDCGAPAGPARTVDGLPAAS